ncbi:MAG: hypothetical protein ACYTGG_08320 [Planctomycetota bacterium]|jgi:hypothetical protein
MSAPLHDFWEIGNESFHALVQPRMACHVRGRVSDRLARMPMHGDALIARPDDCIMRSERIDAAPEVVWQWLSQLYRGAGVYGWIRLETPRCWSAHCRLAGLDPPRPGDRIGELLELAIVDEGHELVWRNVETLVVESFPLEALTLDYGLFPMSKLRTELLVRIRGRVAHLTRPVTRYLFDVLDFVLVAPQVARLRACIERATAGEDGPCGRIRKRHQAAPFHPSGIPRPRLALRSPA